MSINSSCHICTVQLQKRFRKVFVNAANDNVPFFAKIAATIFVIVFFLSSLPQLLCSLPLLLITIKMMKFGKG